MTEYLLETRALSKSFKKTEAVKKLNLRVRKIRFTVFWAPMERASPPPSK